MLLPAQLAGPATGHGCPHVVRGSAPSGAARAGSSGPGAVRLPTAGESGQPPATPPAGATTTAERQKSSRRRAAEAARSAISARSAAPKQREDHERGRPNVSARRLRRAAPRARSPAAAPRPTHAPMMATVIGSTSGSVGRHGEPRVSMTQPRGQGNQQHRSPGERGQRQARAEQQAEQPQVPRRVAQHPGRLRHRDQRDAHQDDEEGAHEKCWRPARSRRRPGQPARPRA